MNLKTESTELLDNLVYVFAISVSIRGPVMWLHTNSVDLYVLLLHIFHHCDNLIWLGFAEEIVIIVKGEDRWVCFLSKLECFLNIIRNVIVPDIWFVHGGWWPVFNGFIDDIPSNKGLASVICIFWDILHYMENVLFHDLFKSTCASAPVCEPIRVPYTPDKIMSSELLVIGNSEFQMIDTVIKIVWPLRLTNWSPFACILCSYNVVLSFHGLFVLCIWFVSQIKSRSHQNVVNLASLSQSLVLLVSYLNLRSS